MDNSTVIELEDLKPKKLLSSLSQEKILGNLTKFQVLGSSLDKDLIFFGTNPIFNGFIEAFTNH